MLVKEGLKWLGESGAGGPGVLMVNNLMYESYVSK